MYWSVVKANLKDMSYEDEFNHWYNSTHVPVYVSRPGFRRAWRLRRIDSEGQRGEKGQTFMAIYEIVSIEFFANALKKALETFDHPWEGWENRIIDWQRTYYRVRLNHQDRQRDDTNVAGRFWTIVKADFEDNRPGKEEEFNRWYDKVHVPEVCSFPGFRRAWRLEAFPHDSQLGPTGHKYWAVYETDAIDYLPKVRKGKTPWDGIWNESIRNWTIMFYKVLYQDLSGPAW
jgi:hypothetical protein